jgi:hypothetical protein
MHRINTSIRAMITDKGIHFVIVDKVHHAIKA